MQLRIFNRDMELQCIIENAYSIQWIRNFNTVGEFEVHMGVDPYVMQFIKLDNLLWIQGKLECGVIENIKIEKNANNHSVTIKGRFAESYFARRLIKSTFNFNGTVEDAMRELVTLADIPRVKLDFPNGFTEKVQFQATYKNILTYLEKLSKYSDIGFRLRPNFDERVFYFGTYKGEDKSVNQIDRPRVIFSQKDGDIASAEFTSNSQNYSNVCYVGGQGEGSDRQIVIQGNNSLTGLDRREVFINGSDITKDKLTDTQYIEALKQRGQTKLNDNVLVNSLEKQDRADGTYNYIFDYDVGDTVTNKLEYWGIQSNDRVVSVKEIYEHGQMIAEPTFGTPLPQAIDWSDNL